MDGPLSDMNVTALDSDQVGMQACWYGSDYGDSDYAHTFVPSTGSTAASHDVGRSCKRYVVMRNHVADLF